MLGRFQMHYFKKNIGDYAKKTGRLSMLQHGAYTLLIDSCYDRERFPNMDDAIEWTWASTTEEIEAVEFVLRRFFVLENGLYVQSRIREEIEEYHAKATTNKRIAEEREAKRKLKETTSIRTVNDSLPTLHEAPPNQEPLTINHKPKDKIQRGSRLANDFSFPKEWADFCQQTRPELHPTKIFDQFKDYWVSQAGQKGVKLDWFATWRNWVRNSNAPKVNFADMNRITVPPSNLPDPALQKIKADERITRPPTLEELAKMAALRAKA
jgi:uncharacterized protein YdaU (DUF1376 family)